MANNRKLPGVITNPYKWSYSLYLPTLYHRLVKAVIVFVASDHGKVHYHDPKGWLWQVAGGIRFPVDFVVMKH